MSKPKDRAIFFRSFCRGIVLLVNPVRTKTTGILARGAKKKKEIRENLSSALRSGVFRRWEFVNPLAHGPRRRSTRVDGLYYLPVVITQLNQPRPIRPTT